MEDDSRQGEQYHRIISSDKETTPSETYMTSKQAAFTGTQAPAAAPKSIPMACARRSANALLTRVASNAQQHSTGSSAALMRSTAADTFRAPAAEHEHLEHLQHTGADGQPRWVGGRPAHVNPNKPQAESFRLAHVVEQATWDHSKRPEPPRGKAHATGAISKASNSIFADDGK